MAIGLRLIAAVLLGAAVVPVMSTAGLAQQLTHTPARIAVLNPFSPPEPGFEAFRGALHELGYTEGQNLVIEIRWAEGRLERLPQLATELATLKPDVIFAPGEQGLRAAKNATTDTPIVVVACDPLDKLIASLARPGGRATGLSCVHSELAGKRLELMKEMVSNPYSRRRALQPERSK